MSKGKSLLRRIWDFIVGKGHKAMDAVEDNIEILENKVRTLEGNYAKSIEGLAKVSALGINYKSKAKELNDSADGYRQKATQIKEKIDSGEWTKEDAAPDIIIMLNKEEQMRTEAKAMEAQAATQQTITDNLSKKIKEMDKLIKTSRGQITNLKAQKEASEVNKSVSKELSSVNVDGVSSHIEEIENQISQNNAEAAAWEDIDTRFEDDEKRIERKLNESSSTSDDKLLADFLGETK